MIVQASLIMAGDCPDYTDEAYGENGRCRLWTRIPRMMLITSIALVTQIVRKAQEE